MDKELRGGIVEGSRVWLPDGSARPIEEVVAKRLPVLSYNKEWDTRPVRYGANQGPRDHSVGELTGVLPSIWSGSVLREAYSIRFVSGRTIEVSSDQPWVTQRRRGRQAWEWKRSDTLAAGDRVPFPLAAAHFGNEGDAREGYFVGAMLGDGGMTSCTPEFHGDPHDGAAAFMRDFASEHGCGVRETPNGSIVRMRFPFRSGYRNPITECLRRYGVWGQRCDRKSLPSNAFSRDFWLGCLAGLIDTDGCVRERTNPRGTAHGCVEYTTVSPVLAAQVSDALLRLGVASRFTVVKRRRSEKHSINGYRIESRRPICIVEVSRATALVRLAGLLELRIGYKARKLERLAQVVGHVAPACSDMHGYDAAVALDRVKAVESIGVKSVYGVLTSPSGLFVVNGLVAGAR
ncbi:LAGLIDADG family homing endonuclease [Streptomyces sp. DSM 3412]|uniref:LAGLIDADG family homing endonuclease n=1 Tax=Streptomyces gottesmaniae TaxID=3075518 RepID=A0ABU2YYB0_9ACTN|nr:LAGLIDADG family homing endonuclease [Streptomyces sp. DSM 3412]MDT0569319.1 LAGLIDADG family homing endonuclease [Streptomyces sp. DSM 3412]